MATESHQDTESGVTSIVATPPSAVVKHYKLQGQWILHRLAWSSYFLCLQCNRRKKVKLVAIRHNQWDDLCCNACYGLMLSKAK
jgi:hypothetical protein